ASTRGWSASPSCFDRGAKPMSDAVTKGHGRPEMPVWELTVLEAFDVTPRMRRVVFTGELDAMTYAPGQALVLAMPLTEGGTGRRDYTIRELDRSAGRLSMDFVLHGDTPAPAWAKRAKPGDRMLARGPRGRTVFNPAADWHLFCGDETCLPAILHMLETIDATANVHAFLAAAGPQGRQPVPPSFASWVVSVHRHGQRPGPGSLLLDRLATFTFPEGCGIPISAAKPATCGATAPSDRSVLFAGADFV